MSDLLPKKIGHRQPTAGEQHVLEHLTVRPVRPHEVERFDPLIVEHHSLKNACVVGEHVRYVVSYKGQWLGLALWSAAVLRLKPRDAFIGWTEEQRRIRLPLLANNSRLLILPGCHYPNLISRFMNDEAHARAPFGGLAGALGPSAGAGRELLSIRNSTEAPLTRSAAGASGATRQVGSAAPRISIKSTTGPSRSGCGNWSGKPA